MTIVRCDESHAPAWAQFVSSNERASVYHRWEWRAINERAFGHETVYLAALDRGTVVGVLPLVRMRSTLFGNVGCSMPFVNYGGPCGLTDAIERDLLAAAETVADDWKADYLEIRSRRDLGERYPSSLHKVSMTIELDPDPEVVMGRMKREHRQDIRRALKRGFVTRFGREHLEDFYDVLSESWRDLGTPIYQLSYFKAIVDAMPDAVRLCVLYGPAGEALAGAFYAVHNGVVEGMWLGMRPAARQAMAGYVLYWETIRESCEAGHRRYHLGRSSKDSSAETFKRKWNAEAEQLYWHFYLRDRSELPGLNPDNPKYRMAIAAWRRLPVAVTQAIGPYIARSIP
ncbi:MAG: FemAB family PEP-CTERM system-associated protein [Acidobacteria bacterium]|nr:FemAB family PEP-CTERM system-associated protein [Acidobacteriota bacterium]